MAEAEAIQEGTAIGTLKSLCFGIFGRRISYLISGGCDMIAVCTELLLNNEVRNESILSSLS